MKSNWLIMTRDTGDLGQGLQALYRDAEQKTAFDAKTFQFVYIAYLASAGIIQGVRKHVKNAKEAGATREEIQSIFTAGFAVGGARLSDSYAAAMESYDED